MAGRTRRSPKNDISDEPLINVFHRGIVEIVLAVYSVALVYASFVPFDFTRQPSHAGSDSGLWGLLVAPFPVFDILANIGVYIPLGALAFAAGRRKGLGRIFSGIVAVLLAATISLLVEYGQNWVASRVPSWVDVTANALGGTIGVAVVILGEGQIRRIVGRSRRATREDGWMVLCKVAVCVLLMSHLRPFDVVVDIVHTAAEARHADVSPLAGWNGLRDKVAMHVEQGRRWTMNELPRAQWEYGIDRAVDVAGYAALSALVIMGMASQFARRRRLYVWAGFVTVSLAAMITVLRVFLMSHGLDTAHFVCGVIGWLVGCAIGARLLAASAERGDGGETHLDPVLLPKRWGTAVIGLVLATVLMYELVPFDFGTGSGAGSPLASDRVCVIPFLAHFNSRPNDAIYDLSGELLRYIALGVCFAFIFRRRKDRPWGKQLRATVAATGATGLALECIHLFMATRQTGTTAVIISLAGGFTGALALKWVFDYRKSLATPHAEDLLTSQLIEGKTYQALPTIADDPLTRQLIGEETPKSQNAKKSK